MVRLNVYKKNHYNVMFLAPTVFPNNIEADFIPNDAIEVTWSTVFFSNGEITNYTIEFSVVGDFNDSVEYSRRFDDSFVNVVVRASNRYGDGPTSPVETVSIDGMIRYL